MSENKEMVNHPEHYGGQDNPYEVIFLSTYKILF